MWHTWNFFLGQWYLRHHCLLFWELLKLCPPFLCIVTVLRKGGSVEGIVSLRPRVPILHSQGGKKRLRGGCLGDLCTHHKTTNHGPTYYASLQQGLWKSVWKKPSALKREFDSWALFCPCLRQNKLPFPLITLHAVTLLLLIKEITHPTSWLVSPCWMGALWHNLCRVLSLDQVGIMSLI